MTEKSRSKHGKPTDLMEIWTERELCKKLGLSVTKRGKSQKLGNWIRGGLKYVEKSGERYFFEQDVIDYLWERKHSSDTE